MAQINMSFGTTGISGPHFPTILDYIAQVGVVQSVVALYRLCAIECEDSPTVNG